MLLRWKGDDKAEKRIQPGHGQDALVYAHLLDLWQLVWTLALVEQVFTGFCCLVFLPFSKASLFRGKLLMFQLPKPALPSLPASTAAA
jgi:hypothetical protein